MYIFSTLCGNNEIIRLCVCRGVVSGGLMREEISANVSLCDLRIILFLEEMIKTFYSLPVLFSSTIFNNIFNFYARNSKALFIFILHRSGHLDR